MKAIVVYKTKYGSTKTYAEWIAEKLGCDAVDVKTVNADKLVGYDTIVYGGGLYAEIINGVSLITKNIEKLEGKRIFVYTTGITPLDCNDYYEKMVIEKNFKPEIREKVKVYNFLGKMVVSELSLVHRTALKTLKKIMSNKSNPTQMEKLLIDLCDINADLSDKNAIEELIGYIKQA